MPLPVTPVLKNGVKSPVPVRGSYQNLQQLAASLAAVPPRSKATGMQRFVTTDATFETARFNDIRRKPFPRGKFAQKSGKTPLRYRFCS